MQLDTRLLAKAMNTRWQSYWRTRIARPRPTTGYTITVGKGDSVVLKANNNGMITYNLLSRNKAAIIAFLQATIACEYKAYDSYKQLTKGRYLGNIAEENNE